MAFRGRGWLWGLMSVAVVLVLAAVGFGFSARGSAAGSGGQFVGVTPYRVLDTREPSGGGCLRGTRDLVVAGVGGVPPDASAIVLNVTVVSPWSPGYVTVFPAGVTRPVASNLNFKPGDVVPNQVTVKVGTGGKVSLFSSDGCPQIVVDIMAFDSAGAPGAGGFAGVTPFRALDTRGAGGCVPAQGEVAVAIAGLSGVPTDAGGVVLNVTAVTPTGPGYLTVYPAGVARPLASSLNFVTGQVVPNAVAVKVGASDQVTVFNGSGGCTHVVVDVMGYWAAGDPPAAGGFGGVTPYRVLDTREASGGACLGPQQTRVVTVSGLGGVPANAGGFALNITAVTPTDSGFLTVFPAGVDRPLASSLNFVPGQVVPNSVHLRTGDAGRISIYNGSGGCTHVVVDLVGGFVMPAEALSGADALPTGVENDLSDSMVLLRADPLLAYTPPDGTRVSTNEAPGASSNDMSQITTAFTFTDQAGLTAGARAFRDRAVSTGWTVTADFSDPWGQGSFLATLTKGDETLTIGYFSVDSPLLDTTSGPAVPVMTVALSTPATSAPA